MNFTASDFLNADINIADIVSVWHAKSAEWARPCKIMRNSEGLLYFINGGIEYDFGDFTFKALPGQIVRLPGGIPYCGRKLDSDLNTFYCIDFKTASPDEFKHFPLPFSYTPTDGDSILKSFTELEECFKNRSLCYRVDCKNQLGALLCTLSKDYAINYCRYDNRSRVMQYSEYLRDNHSRRDLRISELSTHFHISEVHMRRIFVSELGVSPSSYLASVRIENAKHMLAVQRHLTIEQISDMCGFSSVYYFSSTFRGAVGQSPSEFRKSGRII